MPRILLVEDDSILRRAYSTILTREGYEVYQAVDGQHALEKAAEINPELILLDLLMPKMDGIEFLKQYDILTKHPTVKVIVFSNSSMSEKMQQAMKLGAKKYMVKANIPPKEIIKLVKEELPLP